MSPYEKFKRKYLVEHFTDKFGNPKHTRLVKHLFYKFAAQLKADFGFDIFTCSVCGIHGATAYNGRPVVMEIDHLNRDTSDSRIENLDPKCPNCHQATLGYKNRKTPIEKYYEYLVAKQR